MENRHGIKNINHYSRRQYSYDYFDVTFYTFMYQFLSVRELIKCTESKSEHFRKFSFLILQSGTNLNIKRTKNITTEETVPKFQLPQHTWSSLANFLPLFCFYESPSAFFRAASPPTFFPSFHPTVPPLARSLSRLRRRKN